MLSIQLQPLADIFYNNQMLRSRYLSFGLQATHYCLQHCDAQLHGQSYTLRLKASPNIKLHSMLKLLCRVVAISI